MPYDLVEVAAGEDLLHLLFEPPVRGPVGYVGLVGRASTAGEQGDNAANPVEDDGAGVSRSGEGAMRLVVREDGGLNGRVLDDVLGGTSERPQPVDATDGGARGQAILDHEKRLLAVDVEVLGLANLVFLHDAKGLEEPIVGVHVVRLVREHELAEVGRREVAPCGDIMSAKTETGRQERWETYRCRPCFP
jgi:hypothetical protein